MKILHLVQDEKFPDSAYEFFEAVAPGQSTYMLNGMSQPIKHLKKISPVRVPKYAFLSRRFIKSLDIYDVVICHSLHAFALEVLARIRSDMLVMWIGMGYDYYDLVFGDVRNLLKPETESFYSILDRQARSKPSTVLRGIATRLLYRKSRSKAKLIKRIDFFAPVLQSEYPLVKKAIGDPFPTYVRWNYGKTADLIDGKFGHRIATGDNILIGNSATPTNNHIDAFRILQKANISADAKIYVPLSYGNDEYRALVVKEGKRLFGNRFIAILDYMPFEEYIDLLCSCSCVVMNHLRQQAAGNIFIALYLGSLVYLDPRNPLYKELKDMGLAVHSVNNIGAGPGKMEICLDLEERNKNKSIMQLSRGRVAFEKNTRGLVSKFQEELQRRR